MSSSEIIINKFELSLKQSQSGSITAEGVALLRASEAEKPPEERICYDPYAVHFIRPDVLSRIKNQTPEQREVALNAYEKTFPGQRNSILTRVRFFDDEISREINSGITQLVIIGAGYDTRPYRIKGMEKCQIFELDIDETQKNKKRIITQIFGSLPPHVIYIPFDLRNGNFFTPLINENFDRNRKTLFVMEGLLYYLPPSLVHNILENISHEMKSGSILLFDYLPQSVVDGTHPSVLAKNIKKHVESVGEPFLFGMVENGLDDFLDKFGYIAVKNVKNCDYLNILFPMKNKEPKPAGLLHLCNAITFTSN